MSQPNMGYLVVGVPESWEFRRSTEERITATYWAQVMPLDSPTDSHLYLPPKNILCIYRYLMGCIWCICFFLKHLYLLGAFEGRLQSQLSNNIDSGSTIQHPKVSFLTWNSMKFPDHKTRIIPRKLRKQPKKHTHTQKKKRTTHQCAACGLVVCLEVPFVWEKNDIKGVWPLM